MNMGVFPSGQWGQTVNLLLNASVVRIHPRPPDPEYFGTRDFLLSRPGRGSSAQAKRVRPQGTPPTPIIRRPRKAAGSAWRPGFRPRKQKHTGKAVPGGGFAGVFYGKRLGLMRPQTTVYTDLQDGMLWNVTEKWIRPPAQTPRWSGRARPQPRWRPA